MFLEKTTAITLLVMAVSGCSSFGGPTPTEEDFGNSVRQMISAQTANPKTPDSSPISEGDGERIGNALKTYRTDVGVPERVRDDIIIDVNDGN